MRATTALQIARITQESTRPRRSDSLSKAAMPIVAEISKRIANVAVMEGGTQILIGGQASHDTLLRKLVRMGENGPKYTVLGEYVVQLLTVKDKYKVELHTWGMTIDWSEADMVTQSFYRR